MYKSALLILTMLCCTFSQAARDVNATHIKGYEFSVRDVQKYCKAKRQSGDALSIHCEDKRLKPVERSCEGWITGGLDFAKFNCGGGLWVLNKVCNIEMEGHTKGDVNCVF